MNYRLIHQLRSFLLPFGVAGAVPFFLVTRFDPFRLRHPIQMPFLQLPIGAVLFLFGLLLLVGAVRLIIRLGKGTLAPWNPTQKLVMEGVYGYLRNPMISGVAFIILGETVAFGSLTLFVLLAVLRLDQYVLLQAFRGTGSSKAVWWRLQRIQGTCSHVDSSNEGVASRHRSAS